MSLDLPADCVTDVRPPPASGPSAEPHDVGVLLVDDQQSFLAAAGAVVVASPGFSCVGRATSGDEAIELVKARAPDLVLVDVRMPDMDGTEVALAIAKLRPAPVTILLSGADRPDIAADPGAYGAAAFVPKEQFGPERLRELWAAHGRSPEGHKRV